MTTTGRVIGIALDEIVRELRELRGQHAIGTYYLVTGDNRQVRFGIANGEVVTISVRASDLSAAFDAIAGLQIVRTRFAEDVLTVGSGTIALTTDQVYAELLSRAGGDLSAAPEMPAVAAANSFSLPREQSKALRQLLIEYLGPIGDLVYEEHRETAESANMLVANLAREITDRGNAERFLAQAQSLLQSGA